MDSDPFESDSSIMPASTASESRSEGLQECRVCGAPSSGELFGALSCRACGAFFRRTVAEKKKYKCNHEKQREITSEIRNFCRKCRFEKCIAVGMKEDKVQLIRDKTRNILSCTPLPKRIRSAPSVPSPPSILDRLLEGYKLYNNAHKSIFAAIYPEIAFADISPMLEIPIFQKLKMDKAMIPNMYMIMRDYFCPYVKLEGEDKREITRNFFERFIQLDRAYLTSLYFPDEDDDRLANSHNHFVRYKNIKFTENKNDSEISGAFTPYGVRLKKLAQKVSKIQLDTTEMVALLGIANSDDVYHQTNCEKALEERDQLLHELYNYSRRKSVPNPDIRYGQMFLLNRDLQLASLTFMECIFMGILTDDRYKDKIDQLRDMVEKML